jgi:hypothetical protein
MTPAKRRPATPASQGPTRTAPDVPVVADPPPDAPITDVLGTVSVPPAETTPPTETGQVDADDRATTQSPRRPLALYPLPVWPD